jgi:hypothetical protein
VFQIHAFKKPALRGRRRLIDHNANDAALKYPVAALPSSVAKAVNFYAIQHASMA